MVMQVPYPKHMSFFHPPPLESATFRFILKSANLSPLGPTNISNSEMGGGEELEARVACFFAFTTAE